MIFDWADVNNPSGIFASWDEDKPNAPGVAWGAVSRWQDWESKLPSLDTFGALAGRPGEREKLFSGIDFYSDDPKASTGAPGYLGNNTAAPGALVGRAQGLVTQLAWDALAIGMRDSITGIGTSVGYLSSAITIVRDAFRDPLQAVAGGLDVASEIVNSDWFNNAIDALGFIPIVGWIIKALVEIARIVVSIVEMVESKAQEDAWAELCARATLPADGAEWDSGADNLLAQEVLRAAATNNLEWMVSPRYLAETAADFTGRRADTNQDCLNNIWLAWGNKGGMQGLGFVPGTRNIHNAFQMVVGRGGSMLDIGNFYPSPSMLASMIWEQMLKPGQISAMGVNTDRAEAAWANYVYAALDFGIPTEFGGSGIMGRGWSMSPTADFGADQHMCVKDTPGKWDMAAYGCSKHQMRFGHWVDIPGDGHEGAFLSYLKTLFDYERFGKKGDWTLDNIDPLSARPCRGLRELRAAQDSLVNSFACMYMDDARVQTPQGPVARFAAIGTESNPGPFHQQWENNVQAMFETNDWKHVVWSDVPPHTDAGKNRVREAIEQKVAMEYNGMSADEYFTTRHNWEMTAPAQEVLPPDPVPPPAPEAPAVIQTSAYIQMQRGEATTARAASPAGLAIAAGLGFMLLKGRK